ASAHALVPQPRCNRCLTARWPDFVLVVVAIEQVRVQPAAAALEEIPARPGEAGLAQITGHLLGRAQGSQVPRPHLRVWPDVLDIHSIVLAALHHTVAVGVPAALDPAELQRLASARPEGTQQIIVA